MPSGILQVHHLSNQKKNTHMERDVLTGFLQSPLNNNVLVRKKKAVILSNLGIIFSE